MQKRNSKRAYILIWSIFFSLTVIFYFGISSKKISYRINSERSGNNIFKKEIFVESMINTGLDSTKKINKDIFSISQEKNFSLKKNQSIDFSNLSGSTLNIKSGGPLYISGKILKDSKIFFDNSLVNIKNLGNYVNFEILSEKNIEHNNKKYRIFEFIGDNFFLKKYETK